MVPEIARQRRFDLHVNQGRLEALWIGPGPEEAPTLIFLHEGLGCVDLWRDVPVRLVEMTGCGALVFSRLGYGRSDACRLPRPIDFMHHEGLTVLPRVIRQAGIGEHFLIGHSDGGSIALIYAGAASRPGLLGVTTLAAHVFCEDLTRRAIHDARNRYLNGDLKQRLHPYHGDNTHCAFTGWCDVWLHPEFKYWNIEDCLAGIRVPVLAIQGQEDPYGTAAQIRAIASGVGAKACVEMVAGCRHAPHLEQPDAVLKRVAGFTAAWSRDVV